jgi:predicted amino acid dehydrogenase
MAITTGNAYTVALSVLGLREAAALRGKDWSSVSVAVVGANGNIGQALARMLAPQVGRLLLVGSNSDDSLARLELTRILCVEAAAGFEETGAETSEIAGAPGLIRTAVESLAQPDGAAADAGAQPSPRAQAARLARRLDRSFIDTVVDFSRLREVDMVVIATNSADASLIRPELVRPDAVVSCTSVPSNIDASFASAPGVLAFSGGLAQLPEDSEIRFVGLPDQGMTYGCLAETLILGFDGCNHSFAKGVLDPALVYKIMDWAEAHNFKLGPLTFNGKAALGGSGVAA